jgi:serine phosphatase RsbU (regulator of sigma subunit)/anti-sigma regulatory factor (Ser/Thr protein kinase)
MTTTRREAFTRGMPERRRARPVRQSRPRLVSIRWIVAAASVLLTAGVGLALTGVAERNARRVLAEAAEGHLVLQARHLALTSADALLTDYPELTLAPLVNRMLADQKDLRLVVVVDRAGVIQGHSEVRRLGTPFASPAGLRPAPTTVPLDSAETLMRNDALLFASAPIRQRNRDVIGTAVVGLRLESIERAVTRGRREQHLVFGALLLAGIVASVVLMTLLLRPIAALRAGIERIGGGDLTATLTVRDRTEFGLLADAINQMVARLRSAQADLLERERLAHEMELAQQIQRSLLPAKPLTAGRFAVHGGQWAATEVGGDYYDVFALPDGRVAMAIADVAGKGLAGCMIASMISALLRALRADHGSPAALLGLLDERLCETLAPGSFVTMFYGVIDPETGVLTFASAGHNPLAVYRARQDEVEWLRTRGIPLGAIRGGIVRTTLEDVTVTLEPGDAAVQFTDGVSEATAPSSGEPFGFDRIGRVVREAAPHGAGAVIERMHAATQAWRGDGAPEDDETLLVASWSLAGTSDAAPDAADPASAPGLAAWEAAQASGRCLPLPASLESLTRIGEWLREIEAVREWGDERVQLAELALYETCCNIVEHGYGKIRGQTLEIWWIPDDTFLIRDHGPPFRPRRELHDFGDPEVRRQGRGFGFEMIHLATNDVAYYPGTLAGNITTLHCGPGEARGEERGAIDG